MVKKNWFDRLPEMYQEIVMKEYKKQFQSMYDIRNFNSLSDCLVWSKTFDRDLFHALHCCMEDMDNWPLTNL